MYINSFLIACGRSSMYRERPYSYLCLRILRLCLCGPPSEQIWEKQRNAGRSEPMHMADQISAPGPSCASEHCVSPGHQRNISSAVVTSLSRRYNYIKSKYTYYLGQTALSSSNQTFVKVIWIWPDLYLWRSVVYLYWSKSILGWTPLLQFREILMGNYCIVSGCQSASWHALPVWPVLQIIIIQDDLDTESYLAHLITMQPGDICQNPSRCSSRLSRFCFVSLWGRMLTRVAEIKVSYLLKKHKTK